MDYASSKIKQRFIDIVNTNAETLKMKDIKSLDGTTIDQKLQDHIWCPICLEGFNDFSLTKHHEGTLTFIMPCAHEVCSTCSLTIQDCPLCRGKIESIYIPHPQENT